MKPLLALLATTIIAIAEPAPDFKTTDVTGADIALADLKDKVVVLEWVNFDCPFVKKHYSSGNIPNLQETYAAKDVVWITVHSPAKGSKLEPSQLAQRAAKEGLKTKHLVLDRDGKLAKAYGAKVTPHMFIIRKDGDLAYNGAIDSKATPDPADIAKADKLFTNALDAVIAGKEVTNPKNPPYGCGVKVE